MRRGFLLRWLGPAMPWLTRMSIQPDSAAIVRITGQPFGRAVVRRCSIPPTLPSDHETNRPCRMGVATDTGRQRPPGEAQRLCRIAPAGCATADDQDQKDQGTMGRYCAPPHPLGEITCSGIVLDRGKPSFTDWRPPHAALPAITRCPSLSRTRKPRRLPAKPRTATLSRGPNSCCVSEGILPIRQPCRAGPSGDLPEVALAAFPSVDAILARSKVLERGTMRWRCAN